MGHVIFLTFVLALSGPQQDAIELRIETWRSAWEAGNLDDYMGCYDPGFHSGGLDYDGWKEKKQRLFQRPGARSVKLDDITITGTGDAAQARFIQDYASPGLCDLGIKTLNLVKSGDTWKIVGEQWRAITKREASTRERTITIRAEPEPPRTEPLPSAAECGRVAGVIAGDTVKVTLDDVEETIRFMGIDCSAQDAARAQRAASYTELALLGKVVCLESDSLSPNRDRHGWLLRYVRLANEDFNARLLEEGHAAAWKGIPFEREARYREYERIGRGN